MTAQAHNLEESLRDDGSELPLTDYLQLKAAILSKEWFNHYQKDSPDDHSLVLSSSDIKLHVIGRNALSNLSAIVEELQTFDLIVYCMDANETKQPEVLAGLTHVVFLNLPITAAQASNYLASYETLQKKLIMSSHASKLVEETSDSIKYVLRVSRELNGIRDTNKLLSLILKKAREICNADAGSIYVVERLGQETSGSIHFKITQNESVHLNLQEFKIPISETSIVGNAVIHQTSINIPDLYKLDADRSKNPYNAQHDRSWDARIGYQCRSMLTVPMFDISNRVIGVIQLINRKHRGIATLKGSQFDTDVLHFDPETVEYAEIIAHQAGIALENALLTEERERLFEGFVHASVTAIEQRDPTTSGHSHRVAVLTLETAKLVDQISVGPYAKTKFTEDQLKEIEYASLLHDFGKLGVREEVLVKSKKLYPLEQVLLLERFDHARTALVLEHLREVLKLHDNPEKFPPGTSPDILEAVLSTKLRQIDEYLEFILKCNEPTVLEQGGFERLKDIANMCYHNTGNTKKPLLLANELKALSVSRGSLTREEFTEIQNHVVHTYEFLRKIPWGSNFANVPQIAAKHHEKLDGSGYPTGAESSEIPVQSRIMTIADIYDALTAADRPYKKSVPALRALEIIDMEVKAGKIDEELFRIFTESQVYLVTQ